MTDEPLFIIYYECPACGNGWESEHSCACNDECGECGQRDVEPSEWLEL